MYMYVHVCTCIYICVHVHIHALLHGVTRQCLPCTLAQPSPPPRSSHHSTLLAARIHARTWEVRNGEWE